VLGGITTDPSTHISSFLSLPVLPLPVLPLPVLFSSPPQDPSNSIQTCRFHWSTPCPLPIESVTITSQKTRAHTQSRSTRLPIHPRYSLSTACFTPCVQIAYSLSTGAIRRCTGPGEVTAGAVGARASLRGKRSGPVKCLDLATLAPKSRSLSN
jgi:hypothetical protein